ncbi:lactate utilization protein [Desulfosporosinus sp. PR]|uniref:lactate utilization protein n=1 Tax=Candidatus Desulfosporosinus nitrosoreducens TaxID=3401928 RepID=UPI0027F3932D|nr:lactate utilization protein [Desulfosporosinus sp. PR]MDQ7096480.1 lactate utilization protein [Desulfosporosinus sp. PR]
MKTDIEAVIHNLALRNINAYYFESLDEVEKEIHRIIPLKASVGIGNSQTLKKIDLSEKLRVRGNVVFDKTTAINKQEARELSKKAILADWYISGTNAISRDGHIVNIDHTGNRVAAMIYGPEKVIVVIGINKIADSLSAAIDRAKNTAAIQNAKRAGHTPPCIELKKCIDCRSKDRVCNHLVIIEGQVDKDRFKVFIVNERVGF